MLAIDGKVLHPCSYFTCEQCDYDLCTDCHVGMATFATFTGV